MKIKIYYGYHGRLRDIHNLSGELITDEGDWVVILVDGKKHFIEKSKVLEYEEIG